ncbi:unnamed protein product [Durusdinium trenchii]|uniref:Uncharacterized protein n=1 Tax=Durusdinium trenchii TaxID=1381693 RepID=A0ABP0MP56_9DINO
MVYSGPLTMEYYNHYIVKFGVGAAFGNIQEETSLIDYDPTFNTLDFCLSDSVYMYFCDTYAYESRFGRVIKVDPRGGAAPTVLDLLNVESTEMREFLKGGFAGSTHGYIQVKNPSPRRLVRISLDPYQYVDSLNLESMFHADDYSTGMHGGFEYRQHLQLTGNGQSICMLCRGRDSRVVARDKKVRDLVLLEHLSVLLKLLSLEERREAKGIIFQSLTKRAEWHLLIDDGSDEEAGVHSLCMSGELVQKAMKAHKKKDCKQRMVNCKLCKKRCTAEDLPDHERVECEHRQVTCRLCSSLLKQRELNYHQLYECENGEVICENDGCGWSGLRHQEADHEVKCPFAKVVCAHCLLEVLQKEMRGHSCKRVHPQTQCTVCLESFESLGRKSIAPAMLMMDERRSCPHVQMCMRCAQSWTSRSAEKGHSPNCPECREEYNTATAYPDYLFHVASSDILRPPLPQREKMTSGTVWFVSPLDIRFTHDSISECFAPYTKDGVEIKEREQLKILSSAQELLDTAQEPKALELLEVMWYKNQLYVAGTFNRRLCMYRLLALFATERFGLIKVRVKHHEDLKSKLAQCFTTECEGRYVSIRSNETIDPLQVGQTPHELHWPEAVRLLGGDTWRPELPAGLQSEGPCNDANDTTSSSAASNVASVVAVPVSAESDRVVAAFADHHQMPLKEVRQLFAQLTEEQRWLTCMRFRHDPNKSGVPPIKLLQIFAGTSRATVQNGPRGWQLEVVGRRLAVRLGRWTVVEKEKEQMERSLQAALEKITELQQEVLKLKESEQHWLEEAEAAEKRERALKDQLSRETERRQEQDRTLQVLQLAEREGPQRRSRWGNQRQTEPVSSREDDSMQEPPNARVLNAHEAGFQAAEVCDDDPWRNYDANCIQLKPWDREDEDEETSGGDDRWNDHCFSSPCDTDVAVHSDVHHTGDGSDTISQFIEHWKLRWDETEEILHGLTPEEVDMILRRFSMDKQMGKRPEPLLRSYVESCRRKGFQKHHPTDALAEFAAEWKMPFHQVRQILETVSHPQQQQMVMKEYFCCSQDGTEKRMQTLQRYDPFSAGPVRRLLSSGRSP